MKRIFIITLIFLTSQSYSQYNSEKISFKSYNPYTFNDVISNYPNLKSQEVFLSLIHI